MPGIHYQSSNRSLPCAGNGNFPRRDRPAKAGSSPSRDGFRDAPEAGKPRFSRTNCQITCEGPNPKGGGGSRARTGDPPRSHRTGLLLRRERKFSVQRQGSKIPFFPRRRRIQRLPEAGKSPIWRRKCEDIHRSSIPGDWVVVCAVICEPVSTANSRLLGNLNGNSSHLAHFRRV
jgi:hypothetical protein